MSEARTTDAAAGAASAEEALAAAAERKAQRIRDLVAEEVVLKTLMDEVKDRYTAVRKEVQEHLMEQKRLTGGRQFDAALPDGEVVGKVSLTTGDVVAHIEDAEAFQAWVKEHFPSEVTTRLVREVRPKFAQMLLEEMTAVGAARVMTVPPQVDPATGEIEQDGVMEEVPGVVLRPNRSASHSVRFGRGGREQVKQAWREGRLRSVAPQIAPGPAGGGSA